MEKHNLKLGTIYTTQWDGGKIAMITSLNGTHVQISYMQKSSNGWYGIADSEDRDLVCTRAEFFKLATGKIV